MKSLAFKPLARGSLQGFADIAMDSGLVLLGCSFHASNGKRWVNPPSRPQLDSERKPMLGDDGKILYAPVIEFADKKIRFRWSAEAVKAIETAHPECTKPAASGLHELQLVGARTGARVG